MPRVYFPAIGRTAINDGADGDSSVGSVDGGARADTIAKRRQAARLRAKPISNASIRRLARRGGVIRMSCNVYDCVRECAHSFLHEVLRDAVLYTDGARRKTVMVADVLHALKLNACTLYGGDAPPPRRTKAPRAPSPSPAPSMSVVHYGRSDAQYRTVVTEAAAQEACNAYGVPILNDGDYTNVLDIGSAMYVARDAEGRMLAFLVYIAPGANGYPASFTRLAWRDSKRRIGATEAARRLRQGAGAAADAPIGEILLMCRRRDADASAARRLLDSYAQRILHGVIYAGATRGETEGRSPTNAWRRLGFKHLDHIGVREGGYEQNVMVMRIPS